jgi:hypothetical protein
MKPVYIQVNRFNGGLSKDGRVGWDYSGGTFSTDKYAITKHFDTFTYPNKLKPYRDTEQIETKNLDIVKFLYFYNSAGTARLLGYGVVAGSTKAAVYTQVIGDDTAWSGLAKNESSTTGRNETVFFYYKDYVYMWRSGNLMRFHTTAGDSWADAYQTISFTNLAQPVHHPADDCAYFFTDNLVHRLNNATWAGSILTLPSNLKIVSACSFGNYLAIGCAPLASFGKSVVFLWDRDSSLATISDAVDFGDGALVHLANLNNNLIGLVNYQVEVESGLNDGKILVKKASGNFATTVNEIPVDDVLAAGTLFQGNAITKDNKLYFGASPTFGGDARLGIWVVDEYGNATLDFVEEDATSIEGIYNIGTGWYIAHSNDGSVSRFQNSGAFSSTIDSIYESLVFNAGDSSLKKDVVGFTVTHEPLPTAGQVTVKYRKDEATAWTTLFTSSTDNAISASYNQSMPRDWKEIQFRLESLGGAVVTGWKAKVEITGKDIYE